MAWSDILAAIRWWGVLLVLGTAVMPFTAFIFQRLPDKGYAFSKMIGLLLVSYLFWFGGSLGFLSNTTGSILLALLAVVGLSVWVYLSTAQSAWLWTWLKENGRQILFTELLFAVLFALWVWVRAQNPSITATEKPMEFAFLNSVGRSPVLPPLDPWLSGYAISYYYFGYVMVSVLARLSAVPEPIAFNLAIAWLVAGTGTAAFGLVYNLIAIQGRRVNALVLGCVAAIAIPLAGNLEIAFEVLHAHEIGSPSFWQWLDVRDLNGPPTAEATPRYETSQWWWWRSSRVIHEYHLDGRSEEGLEPIAEFPAFSFVLGDMHPHVLALPFALVSLGLAFAWWLKGRYDETGLDPSTWSLTDLAGLARSIGWPLWFFTALMLGGLSFLNTWDVLIHLFVVVGAFTLGQWARHGWNGRLLTQAVVLGVLLALPAIAMYLPFYIGFRSQAGAPFLLPFFMRPTRLSHFLILFGMPLWSITLLLGTLTVRQKGQGWRVGLVVTGALIAGLLLLMLLLGWVVASSADGPGRIGSIAGELGITLPAHNGEGVDMGWGVTAVFSLLPVLVKAKLTYPFLTLFLAALMIMVVGWWSGQFSQKAPAIEADAPKALPEALPFVLLLILTGVLLTLGPEFVYLKDNFGVRLNTIFKFYYQAWILFGVAGLFGLDYLWQEFKASGIAAISGYGLAFAVALSFPFYAVQSRAEEYRGPATAGIREPASLNGLAYMQKYNPDEYDAIEWLRQNVSGAPVILEAVGGQYSGFARISANTGLPTVVGWPGHENQWRGYSNTEPGIRETDVRSIYAAQSIALAAPELDQYDVAYIYVGNLEANTYGVAGVEKFRNGLEVAYQNASVTIYRWQAATP